MNTALKAKRKAGKIRQTQIADNAGISIRLYQYYEAGERTPNVYTAQKIAKALNTTVETLFPVADDESNTPTG